MKIKFTFILLCLVVLNLFSVLPAISQSYTPFNNEEIKTFINSDTRIFTSLSGVWQRSTDDETWSNFYLPYSEEEADVIYYQKNVKISKNLLENNTLHLYFLGFDSNVEIYINKQFVGKYFGGMTPFYVKIPSKLINSEVFDLKLVVIDAESKSEQIRYNSIYSKKSYSGIIREVLLVGTPKVWISDLRYTNSFSRDYSNVNINVKAKISSTVIDKTIYKQSDTASIDLSKKEVSAQAFLINYATNSVVASSGIKQFKMESERTIDGLFEMELNQPQLWSPDQPNLYYLKLVVSKDDKRIDDLTIDLGFRDIKVVKTQAKDLIYLNGNPLELKGVSYIEDYGVLRQTLPAKRLFEDLKIIKTLGANLIQVKYSAPNPYFVNVCNKLGILIMADLPVYDLPENIIGSNEVQMLMSNLADRMINSYETSPSLMGWGISSGMEEGTAGYISYKQKILAKIHNNSSKLTYKIVNFGTKSLDNTDVDLIGIKNSQRIHSFDEIKTSIAAIVSLAGNKPMFITAGVVVNPNNNNGYSDRLSLEFQAHYIRNVYNISKEFKFVGAIFNDFNDYSLNYPLLFNNHNGNSLATAGLVDQFRQERLSYKTLISLFNNEKEPLMTAGSYTEKTPYSFILTGILVAIVIGVMLNRFRRFREYFIRSLFRPYNFFSDIRDKRIISTLQTFVLSLCISVTMGIFFSSILFFYRTSDLANYWLNLIFPSTIIQAVLYKLIWMPELLMISLAMVFLILLILFAVVIRIATFFLRMRVTIEETFIIVIWSGLPFLFLLPIAIVLMKILSLSSLLTTLLLFSSVFIIGTVFSRVLKATAILIDKMPSMIYLIGTLILVVFLGIPLSYYQLRFSFIDYGLYIFNILMKM